MKILIFSDTHLTDKFNESKYRYLKKIIEQADQVIINGDFWEGYEISFSEFINSPWNKLFPLLKKKKAIYLYGNHDAEFLCDKRVALFSDLQTGSYNLKLNDKEYVIVHGNNLIKLIDDVWFIKKSSLIIKLLSYNLGIIEGFMIRTFGKRYLKAVHQRFNNKIKKHVRENGFRGKTVISGHTHLAEIDLENNYINIGLNKNGIGQHLFIDDGKIELNEVRYEN